MNIGAAAFLPRLYALQDEAARKRNGVLRSAWESATSLQLTMLQLNLELERATEAITRENARRVCIQLPDGLKPKAADIQRELEEKTGAEIIFWAGSCFGACDIPVGLEKLGVDMIIQFGHSGWRPRLEGYEYR